MFNIVSVLSLDGGKINFCTRPLIFGEMLSVGTLFVLGIHRFVSESLRMLFRGDALLCSKVTFETIRVACGCIREETKEKHTF